MESIHTFKEHNSINRSVTVLFNCVFSGLHVLPATYFALTFSDIFTRLCESSPQLMSDVFLLTSQSVRRRSGRTGFVAHPGVGVFGPVSKLLFSFYLKASLASCGLLMALRSAAFPLTMFFPLSLGPLGYKPILRFFSFKSGLSFD